ncbi:hypothetical protein DU508_22945 [Pedobacter chinensis]|uniref:Uncharacterized protein n=1 Tax=Pedobacter chinensis TaxID=2282421 RepID=A0A369PNL1_9SPHI|nr:hypothetical protein [Pedobacter chinensis]RDC54191.1 hypothetical protein DU508_22945 [Pedobacter chinensis]
MKKLITMCLFIIAMGGFQSGFSQLNKLSLVDNCLFAYNKLIAAADQQYTSAINGCIMTIIFAGPENILDINCAMDAYWNWHHDYDNAAFGLDACADVI